MTCQRCLANPTLHHVAVDGGWVRVCVECLDDGERYDT